MTNQQIINKIYELLEDLKLSLRSDRVIVNKIDDIIDLVDRLRKRRDLNDRNDPYSKFRKFQGLV